MSSTQTLEDRLRAAIIAKPDAILDDADVMNALVAANDQAMGSNIVDLRGIAMTRLEARLDRLEHTHQSVIAAAYDNLAGTNQIHRAVLRMLDAGDFAAFLRDLRGGVADILRVDHVRLVLEMPAGKSDPAADVPDPALVIAEPGVIDTYLSGARGGSARQVTLRATPDGAARLFGPDAGAVGSEACLRLDLGGARLPALLLLGAAEPQQFAPQQGTDLLAFFTGVTERTLRRWLA